MKARERADQCMVTTLNIDDEEKLLDSVEQAILAAERAVHERWRAAVEKVRDLDTDSVTFAMDELLTEIERSG